MELGDTLMPTGAAGLTVTVLWADGSPLTVAVIVAWPKPAAVTSPVAFTSANAGALVAQVTPDVIAPVVVSEYVPMSASCRVAPGAPSANADGSMATLRSVRMLTVTAAVACLPPNEAVMVAGPLDSATTRPAELTDATAGTLDRNVDWAVTAAVLSSA
jgi:hypothetical protein